MGYELRVEREKPLAYAELTAALTPAGYALRGSEEAGQVIARHGDAEHVIAEWRDRLWGEPLSDWQVAQLAKLADALAARLVGEDGEVYAIRDGMVEQVNGGVSYAFGKLADILSAGPAQWSE
ncbi:hypothetical protein C1I98_23060 [Spongiactinospora gelatinilytica]|uniref:Uncharacterized protein n=1 Tax=Spongiactinospora gelatinilytica TaxID=2666298 RepID=A0A2W2GR47_9ACTN|nr:hypothetical protein [Spongiactinospora gelatinilytica]PZG39890.1 hypothetical protein C1I98_23060 [Spongiactinospora gelatinilytica]